LRLSLTLLNPFWGNFRHEFGEVEIISLLRAPGTSKKRAAKAIKKGQALLPALLSLRLSPLMVWLSAAGKVYALAYLSV
jgi:hypothetical protein